MVLVVFYSWGRDRILTEKVHLWDTGTQSFPKIKAGQDNTEYAPRLVKLKSSRSTDLLFRVSRGHITSIHEPLPGFSICE